MIHFPAAIQQFLFYAGYAALAFVVVLLLILAFVRWRNRRI